MDKKYIVSFSGGKDSTAMLLKLIEQGKRIDEIIFIDTGVEFPEMYEHIQKVEEMIHLPITKLKADNDFEYYLLEHIKTRGKNKGQKGYSFPDFRNRWCTQLLKKNVINKYLKRYKGYEVVEYHGIAFDEREREGRNKEKTVIYPLIELEMAEKDCLNYCYSKGFTWSGLYNKFDRVSCWCCPLARLSELKVIYKDYPELWDKLKTWEKLTYRTFRHKTTIEELELKFKGE